MSICKKVYSKLILTNGMEIHGSNEYSTGLNKSMDLNELNKEKYSLIEHAERDVLYKAVACGQSTYGSTMEIEGHWSYPCCECARAIVLSGVKHLIVHQRPPVEHSYNQKYRFDLSKKILRSGGVNVILIENI